MKKNLRCAIQRNGRLHDETVRIIKDCGIEYENGNSTLKVLAQNFPLEIIAVRDDDIPAYVADGVADIGIVGENVLNEKQLNDLNIVLPLGFAKCRLSLALPNTVNFESFKQLNGLRIATSYPRISKEFLAKVGVDAVILEIKGSAEIAPSIGLADGIIDIVRTGSTLLSNGMYEVCTILKSEAVLIANSNLESEKLSLLNHFKFRISAVLNAQRSKYLLLNAPNESIDRITSEIPGLKSPTITKLGVEGWSSIQSVVKEDQFWIVIEKLKELGAEGILVVPIQKMVF